MFSFEKWSPYLLVDRMNLNNPEGMIAGSAKQDIALVADIEAAMQK